MRMGEMNAILHYALFENACRADHYFPTLKLMTSYNFGPIDVDSETRAAGYIMWEELNFGMDKITINDDPVFNGTRKSRFINLKFTR